MYLLKHLCVKHTVVARILLHSIWSGDDVLLKINNQPNDSHKSLLQKKNNKWTKRDESTFFHLARKYAWFLVSVCNQKSGIVK